MNYGCQQSSNMGAAQRASVTAGSDFPFVISFQQGATQFLPGDRINITEVRGTSRDMQGGVCRISGTYTLVSHDRATLAASVTARNAADGIGPWNTAQTLTIKKGTGDFVLLLPISIEGWPHVSFYGEVSDFGGNYIGTGDSVLKHWWGS